MSIELNSVLTRSLIFLLIILCNAVNGQDEICNNAISDDGDVQIDLLDSDCNCDTEVENFELITSKLCFENVLLSVSGEYLFEDYYQWYLNDVALVNDTFQELELTQNSLSGRYQLLVREKKACFVSNYYLFSSSSFDYSVDIQGEQCNGSEIGLVAHDGAQSYMWSTGSNSQSIIVSEPGNYSISAIYNIGDSTCQYSEIVEIKEDCVCSFLLTPIELVKNGDFESITGCCFQIENDISNCLDDWPFVGGLNYYFTNACGLTPNVITNTTLKDFKDDGFVGIFSNNSENSAFTGALSTCLNISLKKDSVYSLSMDLAKDNLSEFIESGIMEFGIYGIPSCLDLNEFNEDILFCNSSIGQVLLNTFDITDVGIYSFETYEFLLEAEEIFEGIVIAPLCENSYDENWQELLLIDNISVTQKPAQYQADVIVIYNDCLNGLELEIKSEEDLLVQWYRDGVLLPNENEKILSLGSSEVGGNVYTPVIRRQGGHCQKLGSNSWVPDDSSERFDTISICAGSTLEWRDLVITKDGTYQHIANPMGCIVTTYLTVIVESIFPIKKDSAIICQGDSLYFGKAVLYETGIYIDTIVGQDDCIEIIRLDLEVTSFKKGFIEKTICERESIEFGGKHLFNSGVYFDTVQTSGFCDSIVELALSINTGTLMILEAEICEGNSYEFGKTLLVNSGLFWDTISSEGFCDSIVGLELSVLPALYDTLDYSICVDELIVLNDTDTITQSGIYLDSMYNMDGCIEIDVYAIEVLERIPFDTIFETLREGSYFVYQSDTIYRAGVYEYGQTDENGCTAPQYIEISIEEENLSGEFFLPNIFSPNDDGLNDIFTIALSEGRYTAVELRLYNRWGNEVYSYDVLSGMKMQGWDGSFNGKRAEKGVYIYFARVMRPDGSVLTLTGTVSLI